MEELDIPDFKLPADDVSHVDIQTEPLEKLLSQGTIH
jgi:hypothetical protein